MDFWIIALSPGIKWVTSGQKWCLFVTIVNNSEIIAFSGENRIGKTQKYVWEGLLVCKNAHNWLNGHIYIFLFLIPSGREAKAYVYTVHEATPHHYNAITVLCQ